MGPKVLALGWQVSGILGRGVKCLGGWLVGAWSVGTCGKMVSSQFKAPMADLKVRCSGAQGPALKAARFLHLEMVLEASIRL